MTILRRAFAGLNPRFHLVGIYTLLDLSLRMVAAHMDDTPEWAFAFVFTSVLALACTFGILGLIYSAAAGRPAGAPRFLEAATVLFLPLFWLQIKISILVWLPVALGTAGWHSLFAADQPIETWARQVVWWIAPLVDGATLLLTVYCTPIAIRYRERNAWGRPVREGLALFRDRTREALAILPLVLLTVGVGAGMHYAEDPAKDPQVPGVAQGLALLLTSWTTLAALYGASLIVVQPIGDPTSTTRPGDAARRDDRGDGPRPSDGSGLDDTRPGDDAATPGPPA